MLALFKDLLAGGFGIYFVGFKIRELVSGTGSSQIKLCFLIKSINSFFSQMRPSFQSFAFCKGSQF